MNSAIIIVTEVTSSAVCTLSTCVAADFKETYLAKAQQEQNKDAREKHRMYKLILALTNR